MFDFIMRRLKGYKKLDLYYGTRKLEEFINGIQTCNVYRSSLSPFSKKEKCECVGQNDTIFIKNSRLQTSSFNLDLSPRFYSDVIYYLGKNLVIKVPRGYEGNYTYYLVEKAT